MGTRKDLDSVTTKLSSAAPLWGPRLLQRLVRLKDTPNQPTRISQVVANCAPLVCPQSSPQPLNANLDMLTPPDNTHSTAAAPITPTTPNHPPTNSLTPPTGFRPTPPHTSVEACYSLLAGYSGGRGSVGVTTGGPSAGYSTQGTSSSGIHSHSLTLSAGPPSKMFTTATSNDRL